MLKKMPGLDKSKEDSRSITTIQGRGGKEKTPNSNGAQVRDLISELKETGSQIDIRRYCINQGTTSYPPTTNSAQYGASQNAAWQQHGSRSDSIKKIAAFTPCYWQVLWIPWISWAGQLWTVGLPRLPTIILVDLSEKQGLRCDRMYFLKKRVFENLPFRPFQFRYGTIKRPQES